nr:hypothetical protein [Tanacetum cinerariifolium]
MENYKNMSQDIKNQLDAKAAAIQIIHTGIDNDIYSTVDACLNACEMWKAIERLKHGESINVQDLKTNLYSEFRKFTSQDGESLESYYSRGCDESKWVHKDEIIHTLVWRPIAVAAMAGVGDVYFNIKKSLMRSSMPLILSLSLSMPCDDSGGCVMMGIRL